MILLTFLLDGVDPASPVLPRFPKVYSRQLDAVQASHRQAPPTRSSRVSSVLSHPSVEKAAVLEATLARTRPTIYNAHDGRRLAEQSYSA